MHLPSLDPPPTEAGAMVCSIATAIPTPDHYPGAGDGPAAIGCVARLVRNCPRRQVCSRRLRSRRTITRGAGHADVALPGSRREQDLATRKRVEAAALAARPVHFEVVQPTPSEPTFTVFSGFWSRCHLLLTLILAAALLARRNTRDWTSDKAGALRLACSASRSSCPSICSGSHAPAVQEVMQLFKVAMTQSTWAGILWLGSTWPSSRWSDGDGRT